MGREVQRGAGGRFDAVCGVMKDREPGPFHSKVDCSSTADGTLSFSKAISDLAFSQEMVVRIGKGKYHINIIAIKIKFEKLISKSLYVKVCCRYRHTIAYPAAPGHSLYTTALAIL